MSSTFMAFLQKWCPTGVPIHLTGKSVFLCRSGSQGLAKLRLSSPIQRTDWTAQWGTWACSVARSCRFALLNIRKIRPYLTQHATQLLVQFMVISFLDYCNALLTALPACAVKPLRVWSSISLKEHTSPLCLLTSTGYLYPPASNSSHWR